MNTTRSNTADKSEGRSYPNWCANKNSRQIRELALSCLALLAENGDPIMTRQTGHM
jgi:hypothetical protein